MPTTPSDIKKIQDAIVEGSNSKVRIDAEKDMLKSIAERMKDEFNMPARMFNKMVKTYHNQEYQKIVDETSEFSDVYEGIMAGKDSTI